MLTDLLQARNLPALLTAEDGTAVTADTWPERRQELLRLLSEGEYGYMPAPCGKTTAEEQHLRDFACGKAWDRTMKITVPTPDGKTFSFPIHLLVPHTAKEEPKPAFVYLSFGGQENGCAEEIVEQDVILAEILYTDVSADERDSMDRLLDAHWYPNGQRGPADAGKIGFWAFAACRVLDYLLTLPEVDAARVGVLGHSRLGKTALWAGANDERFTHVFSNDSGCAGAALTRKKIGETFPAIARTFPYWFAENMQTVSASVETSEQVPFDQHFLLAACAPRRVYVGSAEEDSWADPVSEYLCCAAASPAWELLGYPGFLHPDRLPEAWERFAGGMVGYHLRPGTHFLSRHDWNRYIAFLKQA